MKIAPPARLVIGMERAIAITAAITVRIPNLITCHLITSVSLKPIALSMAICLVSFDMKLLSIIIVTKTTTITVTAISSSSTAFIASKAPMLFMAKSRLSSTLLLLKMSFTFAFLLCISSQDGLSVNAICVFILPE